jgi:hypothetical protein
VNSRKGTQRGEAPAKTENPLGKNTKHQAPEKLQTPSPKRFAAAQTQLKVKTRRKRQRIAKGDSLSIFYLSIFMVIRRQRSLSVSTGSREGNSREILGAAAEAGVPRRYFAPGRVK